MYGIQHTQNKSSLSGLCTSGNQECRGMLEFDHILNFSQCVCVCVQSAFIEKMGDDDSGFAAVAGAPGPQPPPGREWEGGREEGRNMYKKNLLVNHCLSMKVCVWTVRFASPCAVSQFHEFNSHIVFLCFPKCLLKHLAAWATLQRCENRNGRVRPPALQMLIGGDAWRAVQLLKVYVKHGRRRVYVVAWTLVARINCYYRLLKH